MRDLTPPRGVQTCQFALQSHLAAVFQSWEINLSSDDSEKLSASTLSDHSLESCHPLLQELCLHAFSGWSQQEPMNSGEAGQPYLGERRQDAGPLVSPRSSEASTSICHSGSLPPSYLIPFHFRIYELAGMQEWAHGCGHRKVKTQPLSVFHAFTQVVHVDARASLPAAIIVVVDGLTCPSLTFRHPDWGGIGDHFKLRCWKFLSWMRPHKIRISPQTLAPPGGHQGFSTADGRCSPGSGSSGVF